MKAQCLPFAQIPHTTRLFTDFLSYLPSVHPFYPRSPQFGEWFRAGASELKYDPSRRERVSQILERQNQSWGASRQTFANLQRLRRGAAGVVTGQQVGLFGGPMFSIYKALTAIKLAEEATTAGVDAVPIFWLATSDHDLAEVNHVSFPDPEGRLRRFATLSHDIAGAPVSNVRFGDEILPVVDEAASLLGDSEVTELLRASYRPGETLGTAFARFYARLFSDWGVILLDASDPELHRVAEPIYRAAIEHAENLANALILRGQELESAGYFQQVKVTESSVLLFAMKDGTRTAMHKKNDGPYRAAQFAIGTMAVAEKLSAEELMERIEEFPENFSPNVLLRPVVQDYLLPTLAYTGGAAETAYFAQAGAVYEELLGSVTPIVPRCSATVVEGKVQRWLRQYGLTVRDVFQGPEALRQTLAERTMPEDLQAAFERANRAIAESFEGLRAALEKLDPTLVDASQTGASKIHYQLDRLRERATAAELRRSAVIQRHAEALSQALYPEGGLQERGIGGAYFLARHGTELLLSLYQTLRTDCSDHQILEM